MSLTSFLLDLLKCLNIIVKVFYFTLADAKEESITTNYFKGGGRIDDSKVRKNLSA